MDEYNIKFNKDTGYWELVNLTTGEIVDQDASLVELTDSYSSKIVVILPKGV